MHGQTVLVLNNTEVTVDSARERHAASKWQPPSARSFRVAKAIGAVTSALAQSVCRIVREEDEE